MSLIPKVCITLNLLRKSHINPKLLAPAQLHGVFDFNATPLAPPFKKCLLHENPDSIGIRAVRDTIGGMSIVQNIIVDSTK